MEDVINLPPKICSDIETDDAIPVERWYEKISYRIELSRESRAGHQAAGQWLK